MLADGSLPPTESLVAYMAVAIAGLVTAIGVLFWQLLAAKGESLALAKELIPVATALHSTAQAMQRIVERHERKEAS